jgi:hypothetical protein
MCCGGACDGALSWVIRVLALELAEKRLPLLELPYSSRVHRSAQGEASPVHAGRQKTPKWFLHSALTALALVTAVADAQQTKAKIDALPTFPVSGRVVNAKDGSPVAGAKVSAGWIQIRCTPFIGAPGQAAQDCALPAQYIPEFAPVITDGAGQFLFPGIPQGEIRIRAEAKGFFDDWSIDRRPDGPLGSFSITASAYNLELHLIPASSLHGIVEDQAGHPLSDWDVALSNSRVYGQGFTMTSYNHSVKTGPDGTFAFDGISPGDYFLNTGMRPAPPASDGEAQIYPPVIWPVSEPGLSSPRTVHLEPAAVASATLRVTARRLHHVSGRFRPTPKTGTDTVITNVVASPEYGGWTYLEDPLREDGTIDIALPDGRYKILVQTGDNHAQSIVEIAGSDNSVAVNPGPTVKIPVKINVSHPPKQQPMPGFSRIQQATFGFELMLAGEQSFGLGTGVFDTARPSDASGSTSFNPLVQGKYSLVTVAAPPWYIASITSDGHNLSVEPYTITDQEHATTIDVELRADSGSVSGIVHQGEAPVPAFVYALPTSPSTSELRFDTAHANGVYRLEGLAPGSYRILAFDHEVMIPFREDIAPWLARGRPITIVSGSNEQLNLDLEPVGMSDKRLSPVNW